MLAVPLTVLYTFLVLAGALVRLAVAVLEQRLQLVALEQMLFQRGRLQHQLV
jgi:hypothetical protein